METITAAIDRNRIREAIDERGLRHGWVAERAGYSRVYLSHVLIGTFPATEAFAVRVANVLDVSVDDFRVTP